MAHLNYNHLYYFWMVRKKGSVAKAADALFLTPQTVTGQIRQLERRLGGKLFKRQGRALVASELGEVVFRYADKMYSLSYEMLDLLNYTKDSAILFEVGISDALSKSVASRLLLSVMPDGDNLHLNCYESTDENLVDRLSQHKLDVVLSGSDAESLKLPEILSKKLGQCGISFISKAPLEGDFPVNLSKAKLLIPHRKTALGQQMLRWFDEIGLEPRITGEFDDSAMMKAFGHYTDSVFVIPSLYRDEMLAQGFHLIGETEEVQEEYYVMFAERMIQHPAVRSLLETDFGEFFRGEEAPAFPL
ncbi:transcriptional activator NhaR [Ferrimonas balearica]|uniref:transcriptional activator NhaR n=1 Tax=Ferrimonas balearica TaxID=44012 RepID=UPI001F41B931|nr:transcriptional activator NhaR [Ferrimonas balearica]MBY6018890.1 transcriptional activator NhaR [Halomonas denitrificans]MBY6096080.1 transcriptional activator NhaR [Ferrimonas balearica]